MESDAKTFEMWWPGTELNRRRQPFQGCALPPELPGHVSKPAVRGLRGRFRFTLIVAGFTTERNRLPDACGTSLIITTARISLNVRCAFLCEQRKRKNKNATDFCGSSQIKQKQHLNS